MPASRRTASRRLAAALAVFALSLAACGADDEISTADAAADEPTTTAAAADETVADDSADEDDHDDEDHDDDHDDEDHDDEDHDDEDHDDHDHDDHDHDDDASGLGAHEHGTAEMTVAAIDGDVAIDLISPTFNVFGFEYEPETDEDIALSAERTEALVASGIITINDEAACTLTEPANTEIERDGSHSEITVSWLFSCENADEISVVDAFALFAEFANFEDIDAQWVTASGQSSAELSPESPTLSLES